MTYKMKHSGRLTVHLPESECLDRVVLDASNDIIYVFYSSNTARGYDYDGDLSDFVNLLRDISIQKSGYHGLDLWKSARKLKAERLAEERVGREFDSWKTEDQDALIRLLKRGKFI